MAFWLVWKQPNSLAVQLDIVRESTGAGARASCTAKRDCQHLLMVQYMEFQTMFSVYEEAGFLLNLSKTKPALWRWIVSSRHTLMPAASSHPYSLISQQAGGEGHRDVARRIWLPEAMDLGVLPCGFWLFASRSKGKEGQNNRTEISVSVYASVLLCFVKLFSLEQLLKLHLFANRKGKFHSVFQQLCVS